jgi:putative ABC transport system substrate-binding protein
MTPRIQFLGSNRRKFITLIGGAAAAWPITARAQLHKDPVRLGFLPIGSPSNAYDRSLVEAFQQGLRRVGLIENKDIYLDVVWVGDDPDQAVSEELRRGAELLITCGSSVSVAAKRQTSTIPIIFLHVGDPIAMGLIENLSHPGRNATGFSDILADLSGKFVDLARQLSKPQETVSAPMVVLSLPVSRPLRQRCAAAPVLGTALALWPEPRARLLLSL